MGWFCVYALALPVQASESTEQEPEGVAEIIGFEDRTTVVAKTRSGKWDQERQYLVYTEDDEVVAYLDFVSLVYCKEPAKGVTDPCLEHSSDREVRLKLVRYRGGMLVLPGDQVRPLDLKEEEKDYAGHLDLIIRDRSDVSARYKPLTTQGFSIGQTAYNLMRGEQIMSFLGSYSYGVTDRLSVNSVLPANFHGVPNFSAKYGVLQQDTQNIAVGASVVSPAEGEYVYGVSLYWSSISGDNQISHTALNYGPGTLDTSSESEDLSLLRSSSFQTGYEFILRSWDRVLVGPKYNFERSVLGGYVGYMWIWDYYHLLLTANTADIVELRYSTTDGYYLTFDMYWRF